MGLRPAEAAYSAVTDRDGLLVTVDRCSWHGSTQTETVARRITEFVPLYSDSTWVAPGFGAGGKFNPTARAS